jgi:hypothetical protein
MAVVDLTIFSLPFKCVKLSEADFSDFAAIYVILCVDNSGSWKVIDVGQSGQVGSRIDTHDRQECWEKNCPNKNIWVCIYKTPSTLYTKEQRIDLEGKIRDYYKPVCGVK